MAGVAGSRARYAMHATRLACMCTCIPLAEKSSASTAMLVKLSAKMYPWKASNGSTHHGEVMLT